MLSNNENDIYQLYEFALDNIPEMLFPSNLIKINGKIDNQDIIIMIDTGATFSIISESTIEKLNLNNTIDRKMTADLNGIGKEISTGRIWYVELLIDENIYPLSLITANKQIDDIDIILGINFLKSYNALIDFKSNRMSLNDNIILI